MTSRLDRLFVLLEAGTGAATRRAAARQLGEVQKAHPEELHRLLGRLTKHLRSPAWETRVAAAQAVEAILANVPEWQPPPYAVNTEDVKTEPEVEDTGRLRCETFDIERVLQNGAHLMGSEGHEYDLEEEALSSADASERLAKQRQQLNARLGLDVAANLGVDLTSVYTNEDLCPTVTKPSNKTETIRRPIQELVSISNHLSSRERNLAKRRARAAFSKQKSRDCEEGPSAPPAPPVEPDRKKIKLEPVDEFVFEIGAPVPDCSGAWGESVRWPLDAWCQALQGQLFSAAWEARHGAASALRELLRARAAATAGATAGMDAPQMEDAHQEWLEDMALRLLCVLALDRFGDFVSDQVVAPVRETSAQTLGVCLSVLREHRVRAVAALLATLASQPQWEARHGALLGFKYLLAAREDVACSSGALEHLIEGLSDSAEDVSAVAATALAPAATALATARPHCLKPVVDRLWRLLQEQDELAAPANAYMALLAALMALPEPARLLHPIDLSDILPRLWPYLDHNTSTVRKATLQTLRTLTRPLISHQNYTNGDSTHENNKKITTNGEIVKNKCDKINEDPTSDVKVEENGAKSNSESNSSMQKVNVNGDAKMNGDVKDSDHKMNESGTEVNESGTKVNESDTKVNYSDKLMWTPELLQEAMRYIYQRVLFEHVHEIQNIAVQVWSNLLHHASLDCILIAACPMLATWLCLAMQPARLPIDSALLLQPPAKERRTRTTSLSQDKDTLSEVRGIQKWYIGGTESQPCSDRDRNVTRARCLAADILGHLSCYLVQPAPGIEYKAEDESPIDCYVKVMVVYIRAGSALQRLVGSLVVSAWARHATLNQLWPGTLQHSGAQSMNQQCPGNTQVSSTQSMNQQCPGNTQVSSTQSMNQQCPGNTQVSSTQSMNQQCPGNTQVSSTQSMNQQCPGNTQDSATQKVNQLCPGNIQDSGAQGVNQLGLENTQDSSKQDISSLAPPLLTSTLHAALNQTLYYDEVALNCNRILQEARDLLAMMKHYKLPVGDEFNNILRLEQVVHMTAITQPMVSAMKSKRVQTTLEERRRSLQSSVNQCSVEQGTLNVSVQAALAGACATLHSLPEKLNPVVRPLMESIKKEPSEELQRNSSLTLAVLLEQLVDRDPCPNYKVLVNLKAFLRCDPDFTPRIQLENTEESCGDSGSGDSGPEGKLDETDNTQRTQLNKYDGILTLWEQQVAAESTAPRRGRPPTVQQHVVVNNKPNEDEARKLLRIQRRGATLALNSLTDHFGEELPQKLPKLWEFISEPLSKIMTDDELNAQDVATAEELISRLQVFEAVCKGSRPLYGDEILGAKAACALTRSKYTAVRHMAARALAALASAKPTETMHACIHELIPALSEMQCARARCGAAEALARVTDALQLRAVPYIVLLVIPLLGRMSDHCEAVRIMSTRCFASLIQLMPLDGAVPEPPGLSPELRERRLRDKDFLEQLFNPKCIKDYKIPVPITVELRGYQQAGVNWLRFLYSYGLHGVLCDDMGLGKTLQSIAVVASAHAERAAQKLPALPSLVACPPTLTGHWVCEVNKFIPSNCLKPLQYVGPPAERERIRQQVKHYNFIVASYDMIRKDIEFFSSIKWNYCILDEGHVIKNGKTKAFKAIKQLVANHRLILSGTPIQNNVLELWSLFDFLMPGLLGTERQFTARYSRPILLAREPRAAPAQLQGGALACEALHRQVLPFLLRRVKEDVLKELPPKITQDYYCELSPLQRRLYEDFSRRHMPDADIPGTGHSHVFQALHYLQNVCNHPKLVLTEDHPEARSIALQLQQQNSTLDDIEHSAKLPALKQLLLECGIGTTTQDTTESVVSQHRALIFCQLKKMLDIVEVDLLQRHLPSVTYLRLDGKVPPHKRHAIVSRFNNDVSIDVLLLTTAVGGLGLNLTGADTVIFVEHDWNPMKDLQAMDRAHRIGQKKVVNVYRLISRDTLEEKIMGLQKFKLLTANTVISSENAAMETMGTEQLLDLFKVASDNAGAPPPATEAPPDLWDDAQYEDEYDMTMFIKGLNKMKT